MSLWLNFESKPSPLRQLREEAVADALRSVAQELNYSFEKQTGGSLIHICPEGDIQLSFKNGKLSGEIQTNVAGPGFHKACVDFLDRLAAELHVSFKVEDETDYFTRRSFSSMKRKMLDWLDSLFTQTVFGEHSGEYNNVCLCWDISTYIPESRDSLITPCGLLDPELAKHYIDTKQIEQLGNLFWVWPNEGKDAYYYRGCALSILWKDVIWRKPETDGERNSIRRALEYLEKAARLDQSIRLPEREWKELCGLAGEKYHELPNPALEYPKPIGYRRETVKYQFPKGYTFNLPGTFLMEYDSDGTPVLFDGGRTFRLSVFGMRKEGGDARTVMDFSKMTSEDLDKRQDSTKDEHRYMMQIGKASEAGKLYGILSGKVVGREFAAFATICWEDEADEAWAVKTLESIRVEGRKS